MFRLVVVALAVVGLFSLSGGGVGALLLAPLAVFVVLGAVGCGMRARHGARRGDTARRSRRAEPAPWREERFEEWHRIAHARAEVDSWVEGMPGQE